MRTPIVVGVRMTKETDKEKVSDTNGTADLKSN